MGDDDRRRPRRELPVGELEAVRVAHAAEPYVTEVVEAQVTVALRRRLLRLTFAYFGALALAVTVIVVGGRASDRATRHVERTDHAALRAAEIAACRRVQVLRDRDNVFRGTVYGFVEAARRVREAEARASRSPTDRAAVRAYAVIAASVFYLPPTDCPQAVDHASTYKAPQPLPYREALRRHLVPPPAGRR